MVGAADVRPDDAYDSLESYRRGAASFEGSSRLQGILPDSSISFYAVCLVIETRTAISQNNVSSSESGRTAFRKRRGPLWVRGHCCKRTALWSTAGSTSTSTECLPAA